MPRPFNPSSYNGWRKLVYRRDSYRCVKCSSAKRIEAHHIIPISSDIKLIYDLANGITLCRACHKQTDTYGGKARIKKQGVGLLVGCADA